jgi:hypothetical protein
VKVERIRPNVFTLTAAGQEVSALIAGARMSQDLLRNDPRAPEEAIALLDRVQTRCANAELGERPETNSGEETVQGVEEPAPAPANKAPCPNGN